MPPRTRRASPGRGRTRTACRGAPSHRTRDRPCARATRSRAGTDRPGSDTQNWRSGSGRPVRRTRRQIFASSIDSSAWSAPSREQLGESSGARTARGRAGCRPARRVARACTSFARNASLHRSEEPVVLHPCREVDQRANGRRDRDRPRQRAIGPVDASAPVDLDQVAAAGLRADGTHSSTFRSRAPSMPQSRAAVAVRHHRAVAGPEHGRHRAIARPTLAHR